MRDLNREFQRKQNIDWLASNIADIILSVVGVLVLYLIWRYWSHTAAVLLFLYGNFRNHGYTHNLLRRIYKRTK